jgi:hypothetical protein
VRLPRAHLKTMCTDVFSQFIEKEKEKENLETAIYPAEPHGFAQLSLLLDEDPRIYKLLEAYL